MNKVQPNKLRHLINRLQIEIFARSRGQKIILLPARHTRPAKRMRNIDVDKLLELQDSSDAKSPDLLNPDVYKRHTGCNSLQHLHASGDCQWSAR